MSERDNKTPRLYLAVAPVPPLRLAPASFTKSLFQTEKPKATPPRDVPLYLKTER